MSNKIENETANSTNMVLRPVLGQTYFYFDDGKIRESRRDEVVITDVIPFEKIDTATLEMWESEVKRCDWGLYEKTTDFFVKGTLGKYKHELIFVRSKWGWFSFGSYLWDGRLDVDGTLNARLNEA